MVIDSETGAAVLIVVSKTHGTFKVLIDVEDWERVNNHRWSVAKGRNDLIYFETKSNEDHRYLHRFIMDAAKGVLVDHRNPADTLDHRKTRLRVVTNKQNQHNRRSWRTRETSSVFKGVSWNKDMRRWQAHIMVDQRSMYLGTSDSEIGAAHLYDAAAIKHFGEYAHLNFPQESHKGA
jgi:hypothetical protein